MRNDEKRQFGQVQSDLIWTLHAVGARNFTKRRTSWNSQGLTTCLAYGHASNSPGQQLAPVGRQSFISNFWGTPLGKVNAGEEKLTRQPQVWSRSVGAWFTSLHIWQQLGVYKLVNASTNNLSLLERVQLWKTTRTHRELGSAGAERNKKNTKKTNMWNNS